MEMVLGEERVEFSKKAGTERVMASGGPLEKGTVIIWRDSEMGVGTPDRWLLCAKYSTKCNMVVCGI